MKREIEFRGRTAKGEWVYGCLLNDKHDRIGFYNSAYKFEINAVIPETVGQYVGITDKNGKKIFDGDILKVDRILELWCNIKKEETFYGVVEYSKEDTRFVTNGETYKNMPLFVKYNISYEVIGNIFDKESDNGD